MPGKVLHINFLGGFSLIYNDQAITGINTMRLQSLLAYLILHADTPQPRQHVAFLLWPDTSESNARNNLRQFLHQLRQALPDPDRFLSITAQTLCWQTDDDQMIDVRRFDHALANAAAAEQRADWNSARHGLKEALVAYQGDLLPGCYDEWISPERDRLRQQCLDAHQKLTHLLEQQRDYPSALQIAQAMLRLDPVDESTYLTLMRLHNLNHDRAAARRIYLTAVETLRRELDVEPGEALRRAYERMQRAPDSHSPERAADSFQLVGRQIEWRQLQAAWQRAAYGDAHLVIITGEAGIGKSRLAEELFRWAEQQNFTAAYSRSYAAEGRLSFAPVADWLRSAALRPHINSTLGKVWLTEITRLLPELLSEQVDLAQPEPISEYGQRQRFFEALARAILAAPQPVLLWIDDLQWCDPDTLEWLHFLLRYKPRHPLLVLGTARSEESPPDHPLAHLARQLRAESKLTSIELSPLDAAETARLASQIEGHELTVAASMRLYRETEGNPLFVLETIRANPGSTFAAVAQAAVETDRGSPLPPRVQAVIGGRLAQLSPVARKIAELGAAIGRAFTFDVLQHAGQDDENSLVQALDELWQKRIVREQSANLFDFTHDKLREVAYAEIGAPQRHLLHRRIAQALESLYADQLDPVSAQIAAHYERAALSEQALPYYQRASELAASVYANEDAIELLTRGLKLLSQHLPGAKRDAQELRLQLAISSLYSITKGWTSPEVERCLDRALVLSDKVGDPAQRAQTLHGLQILYVVQARLEKVQDMHPEMEKLFVLTQGNVPPYARLMYTSARFHVGHILEAREQIESIVAVRDEHYLHNLWASQSWNYLVHGYAYHSHILWCLGYGQSALHSAQTAIEVAHEFVQPFDRAKALTYQALLQEWCAGPDTFRAHAEDAYALTREGQAPYYHAWASILIHFAQAWQQPDREHVAQLRDAIRLFTETGAHLRLPVYFSLLARACQRAGNIDDGLIALEQAFAESQLNKEHWWDAELHRLRGELMWSQGVSADEVEAAFCRSLEIAQSQQAKSLELRTATSLAHLWLATGRSDAARQLLLPVYGWFTEGFDTSDLQAAQTLIAQLQ